MRIFLPETVDDAVNLLGQGAGYRCLAGGGVVVPALRAGDLPAGLVSLRRLSGLKGIESRPDGALSIGAMTRHEAVASADILAGGNALVRQAAGQIAHPVIRAMATIGGSLCAADPSGDYGCALLAAGADIHLLSREAERSVAIDEFLTGDGATARRDDELLTRIVLPSGDSGSGAYVRFSRVDGDYPVVAAAVRLDWSGGAVAAARVSVGGCGPLPYRMPDAEALLRGLSSGGDVPRWLFDAYVGAARPVSDLKGSADYRRMLIPGLLRRALDRAFADGPTG
jgi:carbon-monoxide dehydrogenase medium subunit